VGLGEIRVPAVHSSARAHRQELKHRTPAAVHRLGDVGKGLPEDADILDFLDTDISGLAKDPELSFDFVTSEVRTKLAHLPT